jgi:hypothetical protein
MGVIVLAVLLLYLGLWVATLIITYHVATRRGAPPSRAWRATGVAFLVMYLLLFWDWLPTVAAHRYYCWKDSGFTVYQTLDQWKQENPGVAETLRWKDPSDYAADPRTGTQHYFLNQRFIWEIRDSDLPLVPVTIREDRLVDRKTNEVLARAVDLGTGCGGPMTSDTFCSWKSWLNQGPCDITGKAVGEFHAMVTAAKRLGRQQ